MQPTEPPASRRRTRKEEAEFVFASFRELGLEPVPGSRIHRMHRAFMKRDHIPDGDADFELALEAGRDLQMLAFAFQQFNPASCSPKFRTEMAKVIKDAVLPQDSVQHTPGRDTQFELFVAAICQSAGLDPIWPAEPDVTCNVGEQKIGIACKRVKGQASFLTRIRDAAKQVQRSGLPGVIALDTVVLFNPDNDRIKRPISDEEFRELYLEYLQQFVMSQSYTASAYQSC